MMIIDRNENRSETLMLLQDTGLRIVIDTPRRTVLRDGKGPDVTIVWKS